MASVVMAALAGATWADPSTPPPRPTIAMEDQFERVHRASDHRGDILVLIYGDRRSADANKALGEWLHVTFHPSARGLPPAQARRQPVRPLPGLAPGQRSPDVLAVPVACIGNVPGLVRKLIRGQVRSGSPEVAVWLDFAGQMKDLFGVKSGVPNVAVLDAKGNYRHAVSGKLDARQLAELAEVIEKLRREAGAPAK
jgi:hypothetical protein